MRIKKGSLLNKNTHVHTHTHIHRHTYTDTQTQTHKHRHTYLHRHSSAIINLRPNETELKHVVQITVETPIVAYKNNKTCKKIQQVHSATANDRFYSTSSYCFYLLNLSAGRYSIVCSCLLTYIFL